MPTNTAIQDLFAFRNISESIEKVKSGIPKCFPSAMETITENVIGNETTFHTFYGQRKLVQRAEYASPAKVYAQQKVGAKGLVLAFFPGQVAIEQELILRLRQVNDVMAQDRAKDFIARASVDHVQRFKNNRIAHMTQLLSKGVLWYDSSGNLQQTSSGAAVTVDMGIPAGNQNQVGGIIDASWGTAGTNIYQHIVNLKKKAIQQTGRPLVHAFYGNNIAGYIYSNTSFKYYFQFNPQYYQAFANNPGVIPDGFMGLQWHPMNEAFYVTEANASTDTVTELWDGDQVTFTPEITRDVYTLFEGSVAVPTQIGIGGADLSIALENTEVKYGMYGFSKFEVGSAMTASLVYGDTMMPMWKSEYDMYIVDTVP